MECETIIRLKDITYEVLTRNATFLDSPEQVNELKPGEIIQVERLGPMVYEGMIQDRFAFMTNILSSGNDGNVISSWRGIGPYITPESPGLLDFHNWACVKIYSPAENPELYKQKVDLMLKAVGLVEAIK